MNREKFLEEWGAPILAAIVAVLLVLLFNALFK
jgi:hypothetical protein